MLETRKNTSSQNQRKISVSGCYKDWFVRNKKWSLKSEITQSHTTEALKCNEREIMHYKLSKRSLADSIQGLSIGTALVRLRQFLLIRSRCVQLGMCYWDNFRCFRDKLDYEMTHLKFAYINP